MQSTPLITVRASIMSDYTQLIEYDEFLGDRRLDMQAGRLLVADVGDTKAAGYCCVDPTDFLGWPLLSRLCVHPNCRRMGIALSLVKAVQQDPRNMRLFTSTENSNTAMLKLFSKCSADPIGHVDKLNFSEERECLYRLK